MNGRRNANTQPTSLPQDATAEAKRKLDLKILEVSDALDADLFLYSGPLYQPIVDNFISCVEEADPKRRENGKSNAVLILTTHGGDADAAYIMARLLQNTYEKLYLMLFGYCQSAGTLIALGATEIIMSHRGRLGPLDVQLPKQDELVRRNSGLDIVKALNELTDHCLDTWEKHFYNIIESSSGLISTKTAADIATSLSVGLVAPITAQIDPLRVGEVQRATQIAYDYGMRLGANPKTVQQLVGNYSSHSFVIDVQEAMALFPAVRYPEFIEYELEDALREWHRIEHRTDCIRYPYNARQIPTPTGVTKFLGPKTITEVPDEQQPAFPPVNTNAEWPQDSGDDSSALQPDGTERGEEGASPSAAQAQRTRPQRTNGTNGDGQE